MSNKVKIEQDIKQQGDIVRKLKQAKESKEKVSTFGASLLHHSVFMRTYDSAFNRGYKKKEFSQRNLKVHYQMGLKKIPRELDQ